MIQIDGGSPHCPCFGIHFSFKGLIFTVKLQISSRTLLLSISSTERYSLLRSKSWQPVLISSFVDYLCKIVLKRGALF
jgi:hypothetical protein